MLGMPHCAHLILHIPLYVDALKLGSFKLHNDPKDSWWVGKNGSVDLKAIIYNSSGD